MEGRLHRSRGLSHNFIRKAAYFVWRAVRIVTLLDLDVRCAVYPKDNFTALMVYYSYGRRPLLALQVHYDILRYSISMPTFVIINAT